MAESTTDNRATTRVDPALAPTAKSIIDEATFWKGFRC
jgi:hypothetical protein